MNDSTETYHQLAIFDFVSKNYCASICPNPELTPTQHFIFAAWLRKSSLSLESRGKNYDFFMERAGAKVMPMARYIYVL